MALTLADMWTAATSIGVYTATVSSGCANVAVAVIKESTGTPNHAARLNWAHDTLDNPQGMGKRMIWGVLGDPVIQAALPNVSDAMVITSITALVDAYAA